MHASREWLFVLGQVIGFSTTDGIGMHGEAVCRKAAWASCTGNAHQAGPAVECQGAHVHTVAVPRGCVLSASAGSNSAARDAHVAVYAAPWPWPSTAHASRSKGTQWESGVRSSSGLASLSRAVRMTSCRRKMMPCPLLAHAAVLILQLYTALPRIVGLVSRTRHHETSLVSVGYRQMYGNHVSIVCAPVVLS